MRAWERERGRSASRRSYGRCPNLLTTCSGVLPAIRKACRSDVAEITAIVRANLSDLTSEIAPRPTFARSIRDSWLAVLGDQVVGLASLHDDRADLAELGTVAVHPSQQGRGGR